MLGDRSALIVATSAYEDTGLRALRAPAQDAEALQRVFANPSIGGFDVSLAVDQPEHRLRRVIASFFANRRRDDLLVVHLSCHGVKDDDGHLYFAASDTSLDSLDATGLPAEFLNRQMTKSRSRRIVLLLDCCYSGAFHRATRAATTSTVDVGERFGGQGRAVLTASNALEYAFEQSELSGEGRPSVFTGAVIEALGDPSADRDGDGWISIDELYDYVYERVRQEAAGQTPGKWAFGIEGELLIARAGQAVTRERHAKVGAPKHPPLAATEVGLEHGGYVWHVAFGAGGRVLGTASHDGTARVWDVSTGYELSRLEHPGAVRTVAFVEDARLVTVCGSVVRIWDWAERSAVVTLEHDGSVEVRIRADRHVCATSCDGAVRLWRLDDGEAIAVLEHGEEIGSISWSPDGRLLSVGLENRVVVWNIASREQVLNLDHRPTGLLAYFRSDFVPSCFSPDSRMLATAGWDRMARTWDCTTGENVATMPHKGAVLRLGFVSNEVLATGSLDKTARLWNAHSGKETARLWHADKVSALAISPNARLLATGAISNDVRVWDLTHDEVVARVQHDSGGGIEGVNAVAFSPDSSLVASGATDHYARLRRLARSR